MQIGDKVWIRRDKTLYDLMRNIPLHVLLAQEMGMPGSVCQLAPSQVIEKLAVEVQFSNWQHEWRYWFYEDELIKNE